MKKDRLYYNLSEYFRQKYGRRLGKICIDGGFSCPNRDGKCGVGGCIYCGERGAGEHIDATGSIKEQVLSALNSGKPDGRYVAYFQNFTNTYAPINVLKERYDAALVDERIVALAIGTRPDCIDDEVCRLIADYKERCDVWVELGLQTANDKTAKIINRGYTLSCFENALKMLQKYGIPVVVHLIVGLPGESLDDVKQTADYISGLNIFGIKIHSIYVMRDTRLAELSVAGEYEPPTLEEFVSGATYILTHISPGTVVHRLTGDCPKDALIAPEWNSDKHKVIAKITENMEREGVKQGCFFSPKCK